jgi:dolichol-phosphate mannosyltransferase
MFVSRGTVQTAALGISAAVFFVGGLMLLSLGVLGEYVGRVYDEVRNRPLSIISQVHSSSLPVGMVAVPGGNRRADNEVTEAA